VGLGRVSERWPQKAQRDGGCDRGCVAPIGARLIFETESGGGAEKLESAYGRVGDVNGAGEFLCFLWLKFRWGGGEIGEAWARQGNGFAPRGGGRQSIGRFRFMQLFAAFLIIGLTLWLLVRQVEVRLVLMGAGLALATVALKPLVVFEVFRRRSVTGRPSGRSVRRWATRWCCARQAVIARWCGRC